ncbi:MAG: hypothetical protein M9945_15860 [Aquamicrobium sp.]|uniref:hypothetical protein n=1 Tax=Aquamicrobium sp. TaxID=1872579 RepID=UPI00349E6750|nr:hypothetical protein [Aquamicrobium sp.]
MILLYPLAFVGVSAAWLAYLWKGRSMKSVPPSVTAALEALTVCYILGLAIISVAPWYDDNGAPEFISWRYRWGWAAELAGWLAIPVLPVALFLSSRRLSCRKSSSEAARRSRETKS